MLNWQEFFAHGLINALLARRHDGDEHPVGTASNYPLCHSKSNEERQL